eukprot:m.65485 g.65485  ORF g.65485 m.65485 type:complete len:105 (+) comp19636_c0_seq3:133-447(+)
MSGINQTIRKVLVLGDHECGKSSLLNDVIGQPEFSENTSASFQYQNNDHVYQFVQICWSDIKSEQVIDICQSFLDKGPIHQVSVKYRSASSHQNYHDLPWYLFT